MGRSKNNYEREYRQYLHSFYNEPEIESLSRSRKRDRLWREDISRELEQYEYEKILEDVNIINQKDISKNEFYLLHRRTLTMVSKKISMQTYSEIKEFVALASKYGENLIIKKGSYTFPACSLMSLLSLVDINDGCKLYYSEIDEHEINADFRKWFV